MYKNDLIVAIKHNGKILRELNNQIIIPFGSEYSILIKNISQKRAGISISIDGDNVTNNDLLIIDAGKQTELKRFLNSTSNKIGNAFKFIEKTEKIEKHRGNKIEDGLITVTFSFEKELTNIQKDIEDYLSTSCQKKGSGFDNDYMLKNRYFDMLNDQFSKKDLLPKGPDIIYSSNIDNSDNYIRSASTFSNSFQSSTNILSNDSGITVPGSIVEQHFNYVYDFIPSTICHTITLKLVGKVKTQKIDAPLFVKTTIKCKTCGSKVKHCDKFCSHCGTSVKII